MFFAFIFAVIMTIGGILYEFPAWVDDVFHREATPSAAQDNVDTAGKINNISGNPKPVSEMSTAKLAIAVASREGKLPYDIVQAIQTVEANQTTRLQDEQRRVAELSDKLAQAEQSTAQADAVQQQLSNEHARAAGLEHDLAAAQAQLATARQETTADDKTAQVLANQTTRLQDEQRRVAELSDRLAQAEQSTVQADAVQQQLSNEHARAAGLEHDLAAAQAQLATARQETTADDKTAQVLANQTTRLQDEQRRVAELSDKLAQAEQSTAQADAVQQQLSNEHARAAGLEHDLAAAQAQLATARQETTADDKTAQVLANQTTKLQDKGLDACPEIFPNLLASAHIVMHYTNNDIKAQVRAYGLKIRLQSKGIFVEDVFGSTVPTPSDRITYFYDQDKLAAARIAGLLSNAKPIQSRLSSLAPLPRPGTVEIAVSE